MLANGRRLGAHLPLGHGMVKAADRAAEIGASALQVFTDNPTAWRRRPSSPRSCPRSASGSPAADRARSSSTPRTSSTSPAPIRTSTSAPSRVLANELRVAAAFGARVRQRPHRLASRRGRRGGHRAGSPTGVAPGARATSARRRAGRAVLVARERGGRRARASASTRRGARRDRPTAIAGRGRRPATGSASASTPPTLWGAGYADRRPRRRRRARSTSSTPAIGLDRLRLVHLNDSRSELGSRMDRHEHLGAGRIGARRARPAPHPPAPRARRPTSSRRPGMDEGYDARQPRARAATSLAGRPLAAAAARGLRDAAARRAGARRRSADDRRRSTSRRRRRTVARTRPVTRDRDPAPAVVATVLARGRAAARASSRSPPLLRLPGLDQRAGSGTPTRATTCSCCAASSLDGDGPAARPADVDRRRSTTAPSTTTCSRRRPSLSGADPVAVTAEIALFGIGAVAVVVVAGALDRRAGRRPRRPRCSLAVSPRRHRGVDVHLEPEPHRRCRARRRVRRRPGTRGRPARPLVAAVAALGRDGHDAVPRARASSSCRRSSARCSCRRPAAAAPGRAPRAAARRGRRAASRSSRRATCRCSIHELRARLRRDARDPRLPRRRRRERRDRRCRRRILDRRPAVARLAARRRCSRTAAASRSLVASSLVDRASRRWRSVGERGDRTAAPRWLAASARAGRSSPSRCSPRASPRSSRASPTTTTTRSSTRSCSRSSGAGLAPAGGRRRPAEPAATPSRPGATLAAALGIALVARGASTRAGPRRCRPDGGWPARRPGGRASDRRRSATGRSVLVGIPAFKNANALRFPLEHRRSRRRCRTSRPADPAATSSSCATRCSTTWSARRAADPPRTRGWPAATWLRRRARTAHCARIAVRGRPRPGDRRAHDASPVVSRRPTASPCGQRRRNANAGPCRPAFAVPETRTWRDVQVVPWKCAMVDPATGRRPRRRPLDAVARRQGP